jgi:hypothetical protein
MNLHLNMLSQMVLRLGAAVLLVIAAACARPPRPSGLPAPNPNGCYVIVYEQQDFMGIGDVFNGPARWPTLGDLRGMNLESWRNRIRSLRVGNVATLTAYSDRLFMGQSQRFDSSSDHPRLSDGLSGRIESLALACR